MEQLEYPPLTESPDFHLIPLVEGRERQARSGQSISRDNGKHLLMSVGPRLKTSHYTLKLMTYLYLSDYFDPFMFGLGLTHTCFNSDVEMGL